jgi:hypothetical protein
MRFDFWLIFHWFLLLSRKSSRFLSYQLHSYLLGKVFTHIHAHALHELSKLFKIFICREICAYWILNSHLYICIFLQILFDYFISWLYMRVLKLTSGKNIFLNIFLKFQIFSVKCSDGSILMFERAQSCRTLS